MEPASCRLSASDRARKCHTGCGGSTSRTTGSASVGAAHCTERDERNERGGRDGRCLPPHPSPLPQGRGGSFLLVEKPNSGAAVQSAFKVPVHSGGKRDGRSL